MYAFDFGYIAHPHRVSYYFDSNFMDDLMCYELDLVLLRGDFRTTCLQVDYFILLTIYSTKNSAVVVHRSPFNSFHCK